VAPRGNRKEAEPRPRAQRTLQLPAAPAPYLRTGRPDGAMAAAATAEVPEVLQECGCKGIRTCLICEGRRHCDPPWQLSPQVKGWERTRAPQTPFFIWGN
jgi:hypothetical protein